MLVFTQCHSFTLPGQQLRFLPGSHCRTQVPSSMYGCRPASPFLVYPVCLTTPQLLFHMPVFSSLCPPLAVRRQGALLPPRALLVSRAHSTHCLFVPTLPLSLPSWSPPSSVGPWLCWESQTSHYGWGLLPPNPHSAS
jgi:hypothetical protein